jgi:hypothetical protein
VERAPLPPHERAWRHPSELAAANRSALSAEATSNTSRTIALVGGAAGVLAVALFVLTIAPHGRDTPVAVSSTSSPGSATSPPRVASASLGREIAGLAVHPIVTPIGDDGMAVTSSRSIARTTQSNPPRFESGPIDVVLVTGHIARALVVDPGESGGLAWLSLDAGNVDHGLDVAVEMPRAGDVVTVLADPPMLVDFAHIEQVEAADGTPVVDDDGDVVGMCIEQDDSGQADFTPIGELVGAGATSGQD